MAASQTVSLYYRHDLLPLRTRRLEPRRRRFRADPGAHAGAEPDHAARAVRRADAIRLASKALEWALGAIVFAAVLDGIDGRMARLLKGTSRFGAELDSLADFVNFGVAPALILYFWGLHELGTSAGSPRWCSRSAPACGSRASTSCSTIRTGRPGPANFFTGMPAPAGAHHRAAADLSCSSSACRGFAFRRRSPSSTRWPSRS